MFSLSSTAVQADRIVIAADVWCPFNCEPKSDQPGFMVEIARLVFAKQGHNVIYLTMDWERAIHETRKGNINAVIGAFKGDAPDFVFPEQELSLVGNTFFVRKEDNWNYSGVESLRNRQLGAIKGYDYGDELRDYIGEETTAQVLLLGGEEPLNRGIRMLDTGRLGAVVEGEQVFWYAASSLGLADNFRTAGQSGELNASYLAFSPELGNSDLYAQQLSEGIQMLRESGALAELLKKYGLKDWR